jgi:hypothetical protein
MRRRLEARVVAKDQDDPLFGRDALDSAFQLVAVADPEVVVVGSGELEGQRLDVDDGPAARAGRLRDARANHDAAQPGVEAIRVAKRRQVAPGDHQRLLHGVFGLLDVSQDPLRDRVEPVATGADEFGIGLPVSVPGGCHEVVIHCSVLCVGAQRGRRLCTDGSARGSSVHRSHPLRHPPP